ncbi:MAG: RNA methyltransferase [Clostridia bacterium]|nr:RNA methyltransferase [Clostridia bacterium]
MANIINITDLSLPELDCYIRLTGAQLKSRLDSERGVIIVESPAVIEVALERGYEPLSLLTDERLIGGAVKSIIERCSSVREDFPVYVAERAILEELTGFALTRGALCAMKRPETPSVEEVLRSSRRIAVLEAIADSTNVGALFRSAAALGVDAVLVTPTCCDPYCRRAVRVSMGTVFQVPWARLGEDGQPADIEALHRLGFKCAAMALLDDSVNIDDKTLLSEERLAVILGTEGTGLDRRTIDACDYTVCIPMSNGVDSLNVAAAGAIAFWQITRPSDK